MYKYIWISILSLTLLDGSNLVKKKKKRQAAVKQTFQNVENKHCGSVSQTGGQVCEVHVLSECMFLCLWNWLCNELPWFCIHLGAGLTRPGQKGTQFNKVEVRLISDAACQSAFASQTKTRGFSRIEHVFLHLPWLGWDSPPSSDTHNSMWEDALLCTLLGDCQRFCQPYSL